MFILFFMKTPFEPMRALMHLHKLNEKLWFINYMCVSYQPDLINNSKPRQMFLFGLISNFKDKNVFIVYH